MDKRSFYKDGCLSPSSSVTVQAPTGPPVPEVPRLAVLPASGTEGLSLGVEAQGKGTPPPCARREHRLSF